MIRPSVDMLLYCVSGVAVIGFMVYLVLGGLSFITWNTMFLTFKWEAVLRTVIFAGILLGVWGYRQTQEDIASINYDDCDC